MPRNWRDLPFENFRQGITDYIDNADQEQSAILENFVIGRGGSINVRNGSDTWNLNPLPNNLNALQLFQLEEYIFAYTDDGDVYWTLDDGLSDWTQIITAADISNVRGADYWKIGDEFIDNLYIIPDSFVQQFLNRIKFEINLTVTSGSGTNTLTITTDTDGLSGTEYFVFNLQYFTANAVEWVWTSANTAQLNAGLPANSNEAWIVAERTTVLNGTSHGDITFTFPRIQPVIDNGVGNYTVTFEYHPIYFNRLKAFNDNTYNGILSVSKFNGHLYLALFPNDRDYTANSSDITSEQSDIWPVDNKRAGLRKIYIRWNPATATAEPRLTSAQMPPVDIFASPRTGGVGNESNQYLYEGYARHTYQALVEGEPREFIVDGPSTIFEFKTEFTYYDPSNTVEVTGRMLPRVGYDIELYPLDEMTYQFYRTEANEIIPYLLNAVPADEGKDYVAWAGEIQNNDIKTEWNTGESEPESDDGFRGIFYALNGGNSYVDFTSDADVAEGEEAYDATTAFGYLTVPQGPYYFTIANQVGYYADIFKLKNRVYQSVYGIPHATTSIAFLDFSDGITGINNFRDRAIVFTRDQTWRMEGLRGLNGTGSITQRLVSDEFGTISNQSIVNTNYGLFFFSRTGICWTDGFKARRVSEQVFETYFQWIEDVDFIRGFYHEAEQKVFWAVKWRGRTYWVIMELRYGISGKIALTTATGVDWLQMDADPSVDIVTVDRFPVDVAMVNERDNRILRHVEGRISVHDKQYTTDYYWPQDEQIPIKFNFVSQAHDMGTKKHRKWCANVMMVVKQIENKGVSLQPTGYNDLAEAKQLLGTCFNYREMAWGDPNQVWRNPDTNWDAFKIVSFRRMFPEGSIRTTHKQFGIESLYIHGPDSEMEGGGTFTSTVDGTAYRTYVTIPMTLAEAAEQMEGYTPDDSGQFAVMLPGITGHDWNIIHRVDDNTTSFDVYIEPDTATTDPQTLENVEWALGFIRIDERIGLENYTLRYTMIGERTHGAYENSDGASEGDGTEG